MRIKTTLIIAAFFTNSLAALRHIEFEDTSIISEAVYYTIHSKMACVKYYCNRIFPIHFYMNTSTGKCSDHAAIQSLLLAHKQTTTNIVTYQDKYRNTLAYVKVPTLAQDKQNEWKQLLALRIDPTIKLQPISANINQDIKLGRCISFYDESKELITQARYYGSNTFDLDDRMAFKYLDFSKFKETHVYL